MFPNDIALYRSLYGVIPVANNLYLVKKLLELLVTLS